MNVDGVKIHRRNFALNVLDGAFFAFGLSFASRATVLPVFVKRIGGDNVAVGLIPVLWFVGFNLSQMFVANVAERASPKKPLLLRTALLQRLPWLLLAALTCVVIETVSVEVGLLLFFIGFGLAAVGGSVNLPVWFDLIAKITPVRLRGRLFAVRTVLGAALGILGGWLVERVLATMAYPESFALLFALAFGAMMVSYVFLTLLKEDHTELPSKPLRYEAFLRRLPMILRQERNFRNFLIGQVLLVTAALAEAFFVVDAIEQFALSEAYAGRFTVVMMASMIVGSLLFGYLADRLGHRLNLVLAGASMAAASLVALAAPAVEVYYLAFVGIAFTVGLQNISRLPIIAELCRERDRPTYVALTNVLTTPFLLLGLAGGWVANRYGYDTVFVLAGALAGAAALWLAAMVREPRMENE